MDKLNHIRHVKYNHVDGPLIIFNDGTLYWMNLKERFMVALGFGNRVLKKIDLRKSS